MPEQFLMNEKYFDIYFDIYLQTIPAKEISWSCYEINHKIDFMDSVFAVTKHGV